MEGHFHRKQTDLFQSLKKICLSLKNFLINYWDKILKSR